MGSGRRRQEGEESEQTRYQQGRRTRRIHHAPQRFQPLPYEQDDEADEEQPRKRVRHRRKRSVWPAIMGGCALGVLFAVIAAGVIVFIAFRTSQGLSVLPSGPGGIVGIGGPKPFTESQTTAIPLTALTQMQVCDKIGNVSINVDPNATAASVTTTKTVHVGSQDEAKQEFQRISVEVQPPGTITNPLVCVQPLAGTTTTGTIPTTTPGTTSTPVVLTPTSTSTTGNTSSTLIVNVTIPNSGGFVHNTNDSVDVAITLPQSLFSTSVPSQPVQTDIEAALGNITVTGLSGVLNIKGSSGNITVTNTTLAPNSQLETGQGNVTFNGSLLLPQDPTVQARYTIQSEQGNADVTLPASTNVLLDTNINVGKLNASDFALTPSIDGESVSYRGPLNPSTAAAGTAPTSVLLVDVSTGNVTLHKAS